MNTKGKPESDKYFCNCHGRNYDPSCFQCQHIQWLKAREAVTKIPISKLSKSLGVSEDYLKRFAGKSWKPSELNEEPNENLNPWVFTITTENIQP